MPFLLKVLNGPHVGAEAALDIGTYVLGSDGDCDFVLSDVSLTPKHGQIEVGEDSVTLIALDGDIWDRNKRYEKGSSIPIALGEIYRLGMTWVVFLREGEAWKEPFLPSVYDGKLQESPQESLAPAENAERCFDGDAQKTNGPISRSPRNSLYLLGAAMLVVTLVALLFFSRESKEKRPEASPIQATAPRAEDFQNFLRSSGYPSLRVISEPRNALVISGVVPSEARLAELRRLVVSRPYPVRLHVVTAEEIQNIVRRLLAKTISFENTVMVTENGVVRISGYFQDVMEIEKFQSAVYADIPKTIDIEWNIRSIKEIEKKVGQFLNETNFTDLNTRIVDGIIVIYGKIASSRKEEYQHVLKQLASQYSHHLFRDGVEIVEDHEPSPPPPLEVDAVVLGPRPFLVTSSGQKVFEGEQMENGYVVKEINRYSVVGWSDKSGKVTIPIRPSIFMKTGH